MTIGLITISDTRSFDDDETGRRVTEALRDYNFDTFESVIVADDLAQIRHAIRQMSGSCGVIFTTGGTGFSPRDNTPEATASVLDRRADNLSDLIRMHCAEHSPVGALSRGVAGMIGETLVVNLPGAPAAAAQGIHAIGNLLGEIVRQLRGEPDSVGAGC
jgi:molybdenum cofactor synthesis domain-containing protein